MKQAVRWHVYPAAGELYLAAAESIARAANRAIEEGGEFSVVLTGGNTAREVYRLLPRIDTDWSAWRVFWGDERCVPRDHPERNSLMAQELWLDRVPLEWRHIFPIPAELGPDRGAEEYAALLQGRDEFDLVLLGLGEDGHAASLFPGRDWGRDKKGPAALPVRDAPKAPPERVSLSAWRLSLAMRAMFLVTGEGKRGAVAAWRGGENIPAAAITPLEGVDVLVEKACFVGEA